MTRALAPTLLFVLAACDGPAAAPPPGASSAPVAARTGAALEEGDPAPELTFALQGGKSAKLADFKGKHVVVYFYPKDDTPGCRVEAQGFRDLWPELGNANVVVLGVSTQDGASHQAFIDKEHLPFDLVIDTDGAVANAFGVPMRGGMAARQTFLVGPDGRIKKIWRDVKPDGHAREVLTAAR